MLRPFRRSRQKTCAAPAAALCQAAHASSFAIAGQLACLSGVQPGSALTRPYRLLRNPRFDDRPLTEQLLRLTAPADGRLLPALGRTQWQDRFTVLAAAVCAGTRAVAVAASACHKTRLARPQNLWEETFPRPCVDRLRAAGVEAVWLCGRGSRRVKWLERLPGFEQAFVVRLTRGVTVRLADRACSLGSSALEPGERRDFGRVRLRSDEPVRAVDR